MSNIEILKNVMDGLRKSSDLKAIADDENRRIIETIGHNSEHRYILTWNDGQRKSAHYNSLEEARKAMGEFYENILTRIGKPIISSFGETEAVIVGSDVSVTFQIVEA